MGLESGTYIDSLVPTNPLGSDARSQGDDHVRLVKSTILNTFPNLDAAVTATPAEINLLAGLTTLVPEGAIMMFAGTIANIPDGYQLCNGVGTTTGGQAITIPDLTGRFIVHADADAAGTYNPGNTGGSNNVTATVTNTAHALTVPEMPAHVHNIKESVWVDGTNVTPVDPLSGSTPSGNINDHSSESTGSGSAHNHSATVGNTIGTNRPPYYALAYMIKL